MSNEVQILIGAVEDLKSDIKTLINQGNLSSNKLIEVSQRNEIKQKSFIKEQESSSAMISSTLRRDIEEFKEERRKFFSVSKILIATGILIAFAIIIGFGTSQYINMKFEDTKKELVEANRQLEEARNAAYALNMFNATYIQMGKETGLAFPPDMKTKKMQNGNTFIYK